MAGASTAEKIERESAAGEARSWLGPGATIERFSGPGPLRTGYNLPGYEVPLLLLLIDSTTASRERRTMKKADNYQDRI